MPSEQRVRGWRSLRQARLGRRRACGSVERRPFAWCAASISVRDSALVIPMNTVLQHRVAALSRANGVAMVCFGVLYFRKPGCGIVHTAAVCPPLKRSLCVPFFFHIIYGTPTLLVHAACACEVVGPRMCLCKSRSAYS